MAALFDLDAERAQRELDQAVADQGLACALDYATSLPARAGIDVLRSYQRKISAAESMILAEHVTADGDTRSAERLLADGKTSRREQRKKARRAKAVGHNAGLADKMATGEMSEDQVDVIADAADKTGGEAACDSDLIDRVAGTDPDQARGIADDYVADRSTADGVQTEHNRQRALRGACKYHTKKNGLDVISLPGDAIAIKAMWDTIVARADEMYNTDGGRDLPNSQHPRTNDQRKFDAAHEIICGITINPDGTTKPNPTNKDGAGDATGSALLSSRRYTPRARPQIAVALTLDKLIGTNPAAAATQTGLGLIADSVLADYATHADIVAALFDRNGEQLWLGRLNRYCSQSQLIALILRDKRCVKCGADHTQCQVHHLTPWHAPAKGRTDLDKLALLCGRCHRDLHRANLTLYRNTNGHWQTRPATPEETPPPRPTDTRNTPQQE